MMNATVVCDLHPHHDPAGVPGWFVCEHVLDLRVPIAFLETPEPDQFGQVLCHECAFQLRALKQVRVVCPECVSELLKAREREH